MSVVRRIAIGQNHKSAEVLNQATDDIQTLSGLTLGATFPGFVSYPTLAGEVGVTSNQYPVGDVRRYGAVGDDVADDTVAVQNAVNAVPAGSVVWFPNPSGAYRITSAISVTKQAITFQGVGFNQAGIHFYGVGACIELDADDGGFWDASLYNGTGQGFCLFDLSLACLNDGSTGQPRTALLNSITGASYGTGTYGIRDWRGGSVRIERCSLSHWEYLFWGIQSDFNHFVDLNPNSNHVAFHLGARSDQAYFANIRSAGNDTVYSFEGSRSHTISHWTTDTDGSGTTPPVRVRNSTPAISAKYQNTRTTTGIVFDHPWNEQVGSFSSVNPGYDVEAVFDLNVGDGIQAGTVTIRNPAIFTYPYTDATKPHFSYLVKADNLDAVVIDGIGGSGAGGVSTYSWDNTKALVKVVLGSGDTPRLYIRSNDEPGNSGTRLVENYSTSPVQVMGVGPGKAKRFSSNVLGGTGSVNMGMIGLHRAFVDDSAPMSTGTWDGGDFIRNRTWGAGKAWGWVTAGGSPGTIYAMMLQTVGVDRGNADATFTPGTDESELRYATALTVARTLTLSSTGALGGHVVRVVREATATGAFNLDIKNAGGTTLKSLTAAGQWAEFAWDAHSTAQWRLRATGSL